jgi:hypothetical protein
MIENRLAALSLLATSLALCAASLVSACGGAVAASSDAGTDVGTGSSSGNGSGSGSGSSSGSSSGTTGSSSGTSGSSSGGTDQCGHVTCQQPPPAPTGTTSPPTPGAHNYAIHQLLLGDTDRMGNPSMIAWQTFGYDLDGKVTTAASTDVCTLVAGSSKQVQVDGQGGIDNAWGSQIMPIVDTLDSTATQTLNASLQGGAWTQMIDVVGFDDSAGNMTSAVGLQGVVLAGATYPGVPAWNVTTNWPVAPELITGCTLTTGCPSGTNPVTDATIHLMAFQSGGTFVSGPPVPLSLPIALFGQPLILNVASAVITFSPQAPGSVTNGTIAGVIATSDLVTAFEQTAGSISTSLCSGSALESIAQQLEQTSDIVLNGTTVSNEAGTPCNAISIGLGFNATEIAAPSVIAGPSPAPVNPCGDGG